MNLEDALLAPVPNARRGPMCGVGRLELTDSEEAALRAAQQGGKTWQAITEIINDSRDVDLEATTVSRHARGRCRCDRP